MNKNIKFYLVFFILQKQKKEVILYVNEVNRPAYFAVIPSNVRYCEELKYPERLLYGEITALAGKDGYCFAKNKYFAELYHVIPGTISRWISHLEKLGFVKVNIIKNDRNQILERRIYINEGYSDILPNTYKQNKQYPYKQNGSYPISQNAQDNNINKNKIDRFFYYVIGKEKQNPEKFTKDEEIEFFKLLEKLEFNYNEEMMIIFKEENIEKIKIIIYALKELFMSRRKSLIIRVKRKTLLSLYEKCREKQEKFLGTEKEINNFFNYYYTSMINELENF